MKSCLLFFILFCLTAYTIQAQDAVTKGLSLARKNELKDTGRTYALIVGISKYKDTAIPQLQFADRDAEAFRDYLMASGVDSSNIILRTNENARYADIMLDLDDICTHKAKVGDKVFIYFSGHGDVESHVVTNDGYLLPYDAPKNVYCISAINVKILQTYLATLSSKGVQVVLITDACHSGKLAGGLEGLKNIQLVLGIKWQDEIKILSCQAGEISLEGRQWGYGRGLFSFELINGMSGLADRNKDGKVTLGELNRYLIDKVADGANPIPQNPMLIGDMTTEVSKVNQPLLASLASAHTNELAYKDVRGFDETLLKGQNDTIKEYYKAFKQCMDSGKYNGDFGVSDTASAFHFLNLIPQNDSTEILRSLMIRTLTAKQLEEIDLSISDFTKNNKYNIYGVVMYSGIPHDALNFVKEHVGIKRLKSLGFLSKVYFMDAISQLKPGENKLQIDLIDSAIVLEPNNAVYYCVKALWDTNTNSKLINYKRAILLSPGFALPYAGLGDVYWQKGVSDSALIYFNMMNTIDSSFEIPYLVSKAIIYFSKNQTDSGNLFLNLSLVTPTPSQFPDKYYYLANKFKEKRLYDQALKVFEYGQSEGGDYLIGIALCYSLMNDKSLALEYLMKGIESNIEFYRHYKIVPHWLSSSDLLNIRNTPEFKAIMQKYFPNQYKE